MYSLEIKGGELYDSANERIIPVKGKTIALEHSLVSISKWEAIYCRPFLSKPPENTEETLDYIKCMTITQNVDPNLYLFIDRDAVDKITEYIQRPMTATTFNDRNTPPSRRIVTSELIYYWMTAMNIPVAFEKWHLNRLLTLIRVCSIENNPNKKKMSQREIFNQNRALNEARKKAMHSKG